MASTVTDDHDDSIARAAAAIAEAEALLVTAGAGIGVDSGLPDFRGNEGFWRAYPPMKRLGISFIGMANPGWFERDPELAWGFYGHRLNLYRSTRPHRGFEILRTWGAGMAGGCFVFTSNVDGQFQIAGFDDGAILECHGSIHHLQCTSPCTFDIWNARHTEVVVDEESFRAAAPLPTCPRCGGLARPNVLMFGDWSWVSDRSGAQQERFAGWMDSITDRRLVIVELGAGTAVPTVRMTSERAAVSAGGTLIRINLREPQVPGRHVAIAAPALAALEEIDRRL
jgi:NAD-dependent SIR2 family protein deacetylase